MCVWESEYRSTKELFVCVCVCVWIVNEKHIWQSQKDEYCQIFIRNFKSLIEIEKP